MSRNSRFFRLAKLSGKQLREFSYKANTRKLLSWPISFGNVCKRFVYKYSSCKCISLKIIKILKFKEAKETIEGALTSFKAVGITVICGLKKTIKFQNE